jgi:hypothetical protein
MRKLNDLCPSIDFRAHEVKIYREPTLCKARNSQTDKYFVKNKSNKRENLSIFHYFFFAFSTVILEVKIENFVKSFLRVERSSTTGYTFEGRAGCCDSN